MNNSLYLLLLLMLSLSGCSQPFVAPDWRAHGDSSLQTWVREDLAPYLVEKLGTHPRFKGQPVVLVKMAGPDVQPTIDQLTQSLRTDMHDALLQVPGITLPWQPGVPEYQHHRRPDQIECRKMREAPYYIGIETSRTLSGQHRVSIRALDVAERQWVNGLSLTWQGKLTKQEHQALQRTHMDEALRGLRVLPFPHTELDRAADYLANNISCLLRRQDKDDLLVHVTSAETDQLFLPDLMQILGNNLSRYREVRITADSKEADFLLYGEAHLLQPDLYQVWTRISSQQDAIHLPGVDTATYISTRQSASPAITRNTRHPWIETLEVNKRRSSECRSGGAECVRVKLAVKDAKDVFLISHSAPRKISRIYPGTCALQAIPNIARQGQHYRIALNLDVPAADTTLYAIAAANHQVSNRIARHLDTLPDACESIDGNPLPNRSFRRWLEKLDQILTDSRDQVSWTGQRLL